MVAMRVYYFFRIQAFGHRPSRNDIVHDTFTQRLWHFVQFHKFSNIVEHIVVFGRCRCHLLDNRCHMTENRGVQKCCERKTQMVMNWKLRKINK